MSRITSSVTLLQSVKSGSTEAWARLDAVYRPFLQNWFRRRSIPADIADDLTQQVMLVVFRELPKFEHSGRTGAFRKWLRTTAIFEEKAFWRKQSKREQTVGGTDFQKALHQLEDADGCLARHWDEQHDQFVLQTLLDEISPEFEDKTLAAFRRFALGGEPAQRVADDLGLSPGAIYVAKSRVLRRLRAEAEGLIDCELFS